MARFDQTVRNKVLRGLKSFGAWKETADNPKNSLGIRSRASFDDTIDLMKSLGYTKVSIDEDREMAVFSAKLPVKPGATGSYARIEIEVLGDTYLYITEATSQPRQASLRQALIRVASGLPKNSSERREILDIL